MRSRRWSGSSAKPAKPRCSRSLVDRFDVEVVSQVDAPNLLAMAQWVGRPVAPHASAAAKVLLAELEPRRPRALHQSAAMPRSPRTRSPTTIGCSRARYRRMVAATRRRSTSSRTVSAGSSPPSDVTAAPSRDDRRLRPNPSSLRRSPRRDHGVSPQSRVTARRRWVTARLIRSPRSTRGRPGVPAGPASPRSGASSAKPDGRPPPLGGRGTRRVGHDLASDARCRRPVHSKPRSVKQLNPSKVSVCPHESHSQISPRAREPRTSSRKPSMSLRNTCNIGS